MSKQGMKDSHDLDEFRGVNFKEGARGKGFADVLTATLSLESKQDKKDWRDLDEFRGRELQGGRARQGLPGCPHRYAQRGGDELRDVFIQEGVRGKGFVDVLTATHGVEGWHDLDDFRDVTSQEGANGEGFAVVLVASRQRGGPARLGRVPGRELPGGRGRGVVHSEVLAAK